MTKLDALWSDVKWFWHRHHIKKWWRKNGRDGAGMTDQFVVRLWDMFDGWIDITEPVSRDEADRVWREKTSNGKEKTKYGDGDYYKVFPADTKMYWTPERMGR